MVTASLRAAALFTVSLAAADREVLAAFAIGFVSVFAATAPFVGVFVAGLGASIFCVARGVALF